MKKLILSLVLLFCFVPSVHAHGFGFGVGVGFSSFRSFGIGGFRQRQVFVGPRFQRQIIRQRFIGPQFRSFGFAPQFQQFQQFRQPLFVQPQVIGNPNCLIF